MGNYRDAFSGRGVLAFLFGHGTRVDAGLAELGRLLEVSCPEPFAQVEVEPHSPYVVGGEVLGLVSRFGFETDAEYAEVVDALGEP